MAIVQLLLLLLVGRLYNILSSQYYTTGVCYAHLHLLFSSRNFWSSPFGQDIVGEVAVKGIRGSILMATRLRMDFIKLMLDKRRIL